MNWDPLKDILSIHERINQLFQNTFNNEDSSTGSWIPPVDIYETKDEIVIIVELPGVTEESINISIKSNILNIEGEKISPIDKKEDSYYRLERNFGKFCRTFSLPAEIDRENVNASINNGLLKISIKKELKKAKTIKITKG